MPNTPSKSSHDWFCGQLWVNMAPILMKDFSYSSDCSKSKPPRDELLQWLPLTSAFSFYDWSTLYRVCSIVSCSCSINHTYPRFEWWVFRKNSAWGTHEIYFFSFSLRLMQLSVLNACQTESKWRSLRRNWQQSIDGWLLTKVVLLFKLKAWSVKKTRNYRPIVVFGKR